MIPKFGHRLAIFLVTVALAARGTSRRHRRIDNEPDP